MSREKDRSAAILESLRAGKLLKVIIEWIRYKKKHMFTKLLVTVLGVVSGDDVMEPHFFDEGVRINVDGYIRATVMMSWMNYVVAVRNYSF